MISGHKKSSIDWEETIPVDWDEVRAKFIFKNIKEIVGDKWDEYQRISLTYDGVIPRSKTDNEGLNPASLGTYQIVKENDLLFKLIDLENEKTSRVGLSSYEGITSSAYVRVDIQNQYPKYYYYWYYSMWFRYIYNKLGNGVRSTINAPQLLNYPVPKPSYKEQQKIARFLDKKVEKIDELIQVQEDAVVKLEEYKQSVITEAVTKGLEPNVEFINSNISWLGNYPDHWSLSKIGRFSSSSSGGTPSRNEVQYWENGSIPWMSSGEVNYEYVYDTREKITLKGLKNSSAKLYPKGTVMVALNGQGATKGKSAVLMIESTCNQSLAALRCRESKINPFYLNYTFKVMYKFLRGLVGDGLRDGLTVSGLKETIICFPPLSEQIQIVNHLDKKTEEIKQLIQIKKDKIEKLNEYKKSLIYEAVTGKIEVM